MFWHNANNRIKQAMPGLVHCTFHTQLRKKTLQEQMILQCLFMLLIRL